MDERIEDQVIVSIGSNNATSHPCRTLYSVSQVASGQRGFWHEGGRSRLSPAISDRCPLRKLIGAGRVLWDSFAGRPRTPCWSKAEMSAIQLCPNNHAQPSLGRTERDQRSAAETSAGCGNLLRIPAWSIACLPPSDRILNTSDTRFRWDTPLRRAKRTPDPPRSMTRSALLCPSRFSNLIPILPSRIGCT